MPINSGQSAEFHIGYILKIEHVTVTVGAHHDVVEFFRSGQTSFVAEHILEALVALLAELTWSGLHVLVGKSSGNVAWHQVVLSHDIGLEPHAHRIVGTHHHCITHTGDTLDFRDDVDVHVVLEEVDRILVVGRIQCHADEH